MDKISYIEAGEEGGAPDQEIRGDADLINAMAKALAIEGGYAIMTNPLDPNDWEVDATEPWPSGKYYYRQEARKFLTCYKTDAPPAGMMRHFSHKD